MAKRNRFRRMQSAPYVGVDRQPKKPTLSPRSSTGIDMEDYYECRDDRLGYCWCGCGQRTNILKTSRLKTRGLKAGEHTCFVQGHQARCVPPREAPIQWPEYVHGERGSLATDGERVQCHWCGKWYKRLIGHLKPAHGISAREYKEHYGLNRGTPLEATELTKTRSDVAYAVLDIEKVSEMGRRQMEAWSKLEHWPGGHGHKHREESVAGKQPKPREGKVYARCAECEAPFETVRSRPKKFCTRACYDESRGVLRVAF